jgi:hypothetical protein
MLIDDLRHQFNRKIKSYRTRPPSHWPSQIVEDSIVYNEAWIDRIQRAQRYVLSPQVVEAAWDLSRSTGTMRKNGEYIFTPANPTWIEWAGGESVTPFSNRNGICMAGHNLSGETYVNDRYGDRTPFVSGVGLYAFDMDARRSEIVDDVLFYDFPTAGPNLISVGIDTAIGAVAAGFSYDPDHLAAIKGVSTERLGRFLCAALALINTPRLVVVSSHDHSALNASRSKKNRPPMLSYSDVLIRPDSGFITKSEFRSMTKEKRRHHVKTFLRMRRGKIELVAAHWRGNAERGYLLHRHLVLLGDEVVGDWKGGELPPDRLIKPGEVLDIE